LAERDPATGHLQKRVYGPWMLTAFRLLARLRFLRGTKFDVFGAAPNAAPSAASSPNTRPFSISSPPRYRRQTTPPPSNSPRCRWRSAVFGHVKEKNLQRAKAKGGGLLARFPRHPGAAGARRRLIGRVLPNRNRADAKQRPNQPMAERPVAARILAAGAR